MMASAMTWGSSAGAKPIKEAIYLPLETFSYPVTQNVVSEETSATMREILEMVVAEGSGKNGGINSSYSA